MATISSSSGISSLLGQYSGIGSEQIEDLLKADSIPKMRAENRLEAVKKQKTAWSDVKTRLNTFLTKLTALQNPDNFRVKKVTSSDENTVKITGSPSSIEGDYRVKVTQLATATNLVGKKLNSSSEELGLSSNLKITTADLDDDGNHKTFEIELESTDSLKDVMKKINNETKNSGISANIVDNRLVLTDTKTGSRDFQLAGDLDSLGLNVADGAVKTNGVDAEININGIDIVRSSNTISDVIEGVTFELINTTDKDVVLSVKNDEEAITKTVKEFVDQYNSLMSFIGDNLSVGDPSQENNTTGALSGDSTLVRLQESLRSMVLPTAIDGTSLKPNELGLSVDRDGKLQFDESKFKTLLAKDPNSVQEFFYQSEKTTIDGTEKGYSTKLTSLLNQYLSDKNGTQSILSSKDKSFDSLIKDLNKQIERFDDMLAKKKERYVTMFTRLDQALMEAESQMSWLVGQVDAMNAGK